MKITRKQIRNLIREQTGSGFTVGDTVTATLFGKTRKGKITEMHDMGDMASVDFGNGDVYGIMLNRLKPSKQVNEQNYGREQNYGYSPTGRKPRKRSYNQAGPGSMSAAKSLRAKFKRRYPDAEIKIDGRNGWIIVNGKKVVNMGANGSSNYDEMAEKMEAALSGF
tara:strand:+ start:119 stop:616 length:498 start_codon:yes stop_codon:yes gene_type:complete